MARNLFRTSSNPALNEKVLKQFSTASAQVLDRGEVMTVNGAINKTLLLFGVLFVAASFSWYLIGTNPGLAMPLMIGGAIGGLILAFVVMFNKQRAATLAPIYAAVEGLFVGAVSAIYASTFSGIVLQAIGLTLCTLFLMLLIYRAGIIKVTERFRSIIITAIGAIFFMYILSFVISLFGGTGINTYIHELGWIGILICLAIIVVAALSLLLDFDMIEKGAEAKLPKYMEWYSGFAIMITLIWLYLEFLRLLAILNSD